MKIQQYDVHELPQEAIDNLEDVRTLINYGKYQPQVVTSLPSFQGRHGEFVIVLQGGTGALFWCTTDNSTTWAKLN